ncbi:MAG: DeoR/GlpR family DNA-binding transcription regulator [Roseomonas sp.]|nr:DeoR/GlpR family DNA-binding transcription regulator [Roseomonas sp.]
MLRPDLPPRHLDRPVRLARARQAAILERLAAVGDVTVSSLAATLQVSEMTIRRDLALLERQGQIERTHGGAVPPPPRHPVTLDREEPTFDARLRQRHEAKAAIAQAAAGLLAGCRTIALDVGTTSFLIAGHLRQVPHLKIFTNNLRAAAALEGSASEVYVAGGRVRSDELSVVGGTAIAQFESLWFDVAVIGASGLTPDGLYDYSPEEAEMKRVYLRRSGQRILACDSVKFQRLSLVHVGALSSVQTLVTDAEPPAPLTEALARNKVHIRLAA